MTILVVGGGVFVGRSMVEAALERGHRVCVFNRGRSPDPIPGVEHLVGDRNGDLSALASRNWDIVIDACGYFPRQVESLLRELRGRVGLYVFVSSVSAYAEHSRPGIREDDPLASDVDASGPDVTAANYGPMKAMCERVALELSERPPLLIRPGIIAGPRDPTGRLPYWVGRIARGGEVLVPGTPGNPLQLIDSRDLGLWTIQSAEKGVSGAFNAVGPETFYSWGDLVRDCALAAGSTPRVTWVSDGFLNARAIEARSGLPLYVPASEPLSVGMFRVDGRLAYARGLALRPLGETIADTLSWIRSPGGQSGRKVGLSPEKEQELLEAWNAAAKG